MKAGAFNQMMISVLWKDLKCAQAYAMKNREIMMGRLLHVFNKMFNHRQSFKPEVEVSPDLRRSAEVM